MRSLWAGLLLLLCTATAASAQATGYVQELGFGGRYRADCWIPLLVHLDSTYSQPAEYQLQVHQQDLDQDTVIYTRTITLGPNAKENFWVYFLPQPTNGGLRGPNSAARLEDVLKVHLFDKKGKTHIAALPVSGTGTVEEVEQPFTNIGERPAKLVLVVVGDAANFHEVEYQGGIEGMTEQVRFVAVRANGLPDHALGYQAVDAVLWINGDWKALTSSAATFSALQQWIRHGGGQLVVCQPSDRTQLEPLADADMLPIVAKTGSGANATWAIQPRTKKDANHILDIVKPTPPSNGFSDVPWKALKTEAKRSFEVAYAQPRPDAMVDAWVTWDAEGDNPEEKTPFIARRAYGLGSVTWVAQNVGSPDLVSAPDPQDKPATRPGPDGRAMLVRPRRAIATSGWPRLWDRVFGWRNQTQTGFEVQSDYSQDRSKDKYSDSSVTPVDLGAAVSKGMEHGSRSTAYIFIAVLFFIGYWVIAGPGSYLYLAARKKKGMSWTVFGATAVVAALLTVIVVKLLLRGGAEVRHVSVVRLYPESPAADGSARFSADISSRIGLYIPKDGYQRVSLPAGSAERVGAVAPYAVPPQWMKKESDAGFTDTARYIVDTDAILSGGAPAVEFFFRSTLKKVQAQWSGTVAGGITGKAEVRPDRLSPIGGTLTNTTGRDLKHVYFVFTWGWQDENAAGQTAGNDRVFYRPSWNNNETVDLGAEYSSINTASIADKSPGYTTPIRGSIDPFIGGGWTKYWHNNLPSGYTTELYDDRKDGYLRSLPLLALADRVGPTQRIQNSREFRNDLIRRGFRDMDMSQQVAAGRLVILAHAPKSPLPVPLEVNRDPVDPGEGVTFYEISLPLNREKLRPAPPPPATKPATNPTTGPATTPAAQDAGAAK